LLIMNNVGILSKSPDVATAPQQRSGQGNAS
jgi:hypothetical protein